MIIINIIKELADYHRNNKDNQCDIKFYGFWPNASLDSIWITNFCRSRNIDFSKHKVRMYSVFRSRGVAELICKTGDCNIFFSGENVHNRFEKYQDNFLLNKNIDLSIGFDFIDNPRYVRFPYWIHYMFGGGITDDEIVKTVQTMRYPNKGDNVRPLFCSLVASHDSFHTRSQILHQLNDHVGNVCCPGLYNHNDVSLQSVFNNNKKEYLRQFRFNLCPENTNAYGYVTEKIYEAIFSGCIPIYYGSCNRPDQDVINKDAVIFYLPDGDNNGTLSLVKELESNNKLYKSFIKQPRLLPDAEDFILDQVHKLETQLREILA